MLTEDLTPFFADFGTSVTWYGVGWAFDRTGQSLDSSQAGANGIQAVTGLVIFDNPDTNVLGGRAQSRSYKMTFPATQFAGIKRGDALTVPAGRYAGNYSVIEVNSIDEDGAVYEATLESVS